VTYVSNIYKYYIAYQLMFAERQRREAAKAAVKQPGVRQTLGSDLAWQQGVRMQELARACSPSGSHADSRVTVPAVVRNGVFYGESS
jgi:hypothetical protein